MRGGKSIVNDLQIGIYPLDSPDCLGKHRRMKISSIPLAVLDSTPVPPYVGDSSIHEFIVGGRGVSWLFAFLGLGRHPRGGMWTGRMDESDVDASLSSVLVCVTSYCTA